MFIREYCATASNRNGILVSTANYQDQEQIGQRENLLSSISFENRLRILPEGVTSKNAIGEFMIDFKTN